MLGTVLFSLKFPPIVFDVKRYFEKPTNKQKNHILCNLDLQTRSIAAVCQNNET